MFKDRDKITIRGYLLLVDNWNFEKIQKRERKLVFSMNFMNFVNFQNKYLEKPYNISEGWGWHLFVKYLFYLNFFFGRC